MIEYESMGQFGADYITNSNTGNSNKNYCAITMLEDTTFTTLTTTNWSPGTTGSNYISSAVTYPKGITIFGNFTAITLLTGKVIAYKGFSV
jgi:hypothetical protein